MSASPHPTTTTAPTLQASEPLEATTPSLVPASEPAFPAFDHGAVSRFNAWFFATFDRYVNLIARRHKRAADAGIELQLVSHGAETLPLPDASVDEVLCSLVLCTVRDPQQVLAEVRRVLRPGGRFRFVEHVAAPRWSPRRWLQRAIRARGPGCTRAARWTATPPRRSAPPGSVR